MKSGIAKLAGGVGIAAAMTLIGSSGASASSQGSDCDYGRGQSYNQTQSHNSGYNQGQQVEYRGGGYDNASGRGGGSIVSYSDHKSGYDNNYSSGYGSQTGPGGMLYNGHWYEYDQMGYWCEGRWMPYSQNWNNNDWQQWQNQGYL